MSQETAVLPTKDEVSAASVAQPVVSKQEPVTVKAEPPEPKKQAATKAAARKVAQKPKVAKKAVAEKAAEEVAEKSAPTPKTPAKPVKKAVSAIKTKVAESPQPEKAPKAKKQAPKKPKLVRDSFTIPESDYALFATLKQRALAAGVEVKKSELLRASMALLAALSDAELVKAIGQVERIKTGRPKK